MKKINLKNKFKKKDFTIISIILFLLIDEIIVNIIIYKRFDKNIFGIKSLWILFGLGCNYFMIFIVFIVVIVMLVKKIKKWGGGRIHSIAIVFLSILLFNVINPSYAIYSFNFVEEVIFICDVFKDITTKQTEIVNLNYIEFNHDTQSKYTHRSPGGTYISRAFINKTYPIFLNKNIVTKYEIPMVWQESQWTLGRYNTITQIFLEKIVNIDNNVKIEYFKNSKIIKAITVNEKIYNNIEQIYNEYNEWKEEQDIIADLTKPLYLEFDNINLIIDEWDENKNKEKVYTVIHNNIESNFIVTSFRAKQTQEIYNAYNLGEIYLVENTKASYWQITLELGKDEYFGILILTPEQEKIVKSYPVIQVKREEL